MPQPETTFNHRPPRSWQKITITAASDNAEMIADFMAGLTESGIEQISGAPGSPSPAPEQIIAYLPEERNPTQLLKTIHAFLLECNKQNPSALPATFAQETIIEEDWNRHWKKHFKPFKLTDRLVIKPSWEEYEKLPHEIILEMDPGMAFGTGLHASTKLALLLIEESFAAKAPRTVLDIGTGTGILGMACALLGAESVVGLDNDIDARTAAIENIHKNHLENSMVIDPGNLDEIKARFDLVIANITQDVLTLLADDILASMAPRGHLVLSGILTGPQTDIIKQVFGKLGLSLINTQSQEEWTALLFKQ
ncbi:MAG: 50S ribosomal protein L11 methyltransferase [Desulfobulbaceae bacterium]|nr:50S ribosomal protein L11 methyltransferase [Desulfobulbaceae bacterium]